VRFRYQKGIPFRLVGEWMRSVREDSRSVMTAGFEEGEQALMPRLLQFSQVRTMEESQVGATKLLKPDVAM
jgi:hypothetical protein